MNSAHLFLVNNAATERISTEDIHITRDLPEYFFIYYTHLLDRHVVNFDLLNVILVNCDDSNNFKIIQFV